MQVSHAEDHITHAVIGGAKAIEFGISDSAEFFNILSSTLYKDQILAVVRETLCNAWDAHIESGRTNIPVEITLTTEKFTIRDHGNGIHRDDMGVIYGTYGNSTKKNDGKQTGGFGLGCKAPFAYTEHFEVQSSHDGVRTIYNMAKSSAAAMGKPGITPIASFPTKEHGLQVSMEIKNSSDYRRFSLLIARIVRNGDMNMTLNGRELTKLGFDTTKSNYMVVMNDDIIENATSVMVRYGNVIYPVDRVAGIDSEYKAIERHLNSLKLYNDYLLILQAPPHSITVQPSREGLSMQEYTVNTLKGLMTMYLDMLKGRFDTVCNVIAEKAVDVAVKEARVADLLNTSEKLPMGDVKDAPACIHDLETMAQRYMESNYPKSLAFRRKDITYRLKSMVDGGLLSRGMVQTYLRALENVKGGIYRRETNTWLQRRVIGRLMGKMDKAGIDTSKLFVYDPADVHAVNQYYRQDVHPLTEAKRACPPNLIQALPYLRNIIVLTTSKADLSMRMKRHQVFKDLGNYPGFLFYQVGLKKAEKAAALDFFKSTDMNVVDLTFKQDWEVANAALYTKPAPVARKAVKKGIPSVAGLIKGTKQIETSYLKLDETPRIENPEFIVKVSLRDDVQSNKFDNWDNTASLYIAQLFGDKGAVTNNQAVYDKAILKGAVPMDNYIREKIYAFMVADPTVQEYWAFRGPRAIEAADLDYRDSPDLAKLVYRNSTLRSTFGLVNNLSDEAKKYVYLWKQLNDRYRHRSIAPDEYRKVRAHLEAIPLDPTNTAVMARFKNNKLMKVINETGLANILKTEPDGSALLDAAVKIFITVLNN